MPLDDQKELFYLVDENDRVLESITRKKAHSSNKYIHRAVGVFVINEKNEMLMQKRSRKKDMEENKWSYAVGGHVTKEQTYRKAARRELKEELGIKAPIKFIIKALFKMKKETEYLALFKTNVSNNIHFLLDKDEVEQIKWIKINKLKEFIKTHQTAVWTLPALKIAGYL